MSTASRIADAVMRIANEFKTLRSVDLGGMKLNRVTKAQYAAVTTKDGKTLYFITDWDGTSSTSAASSNSSSSSSQNKALVPSAAGANTIGWANEGAPTYSKVATDDGATTAIYSPTANDLVTYQMTDLPSGAATVSSVTVITSVLKLDPVTATTKPVLLINGTLYEGPEASPSSSGVYEQLSYTWTNNPATNAAWTITAVNAMEVGIRKVNNSGERCSYIAAVVSYT